MPFLSIVIPIYNEDEIIGETYKRITKIVEPLEILYELLIVDDGSNDRSFNILSELAKADPHVKVISFSRNFGHQAALTAGLDHANGDVIITMDGDLQHPPELIPQLLKKWEEGYEIIHTFRTYGKDEGFIKKVTSLFFYKLINKIAQIKVPSGAADFKLFDRIVVDSLKSMKERSRFLRGLSMWVGYRQTGIEYQVAHRHAGESKYTMVKMIRLALDGVTSFSIFPLKLATFIGFIVSLIAFSYLSYALYIKLIANKAVAGWASVVILMMFIGGIQLIAIGILGEYIGKIYEEVKNRPIYIIKRTCNIENKESHR